MNNLLLRTKRILHVQYLVPLIMLSLLLITPLVNAQTREFTHHITEAARAKDFTMIGWAPGQPWVAYFLHDEDDYGPAPFPEDGDLHFYNAETGETCHYPTARMDFWFGNGEDRTANLWLGDGSYLNIEESRAVIFSPCSNIEQDITEALPAPPEQTSIVSYSPAANTILLRTYEGLHLFMVDSKESTRITGPINDFDFYGGKGSVSPDGEFFAYTLSGPGDTYIIDISSGYARTIIDEPLRPGEDECCTTPTNPYWVNEYMLVASTQSLGPNNTYGQRMVNTTDGTLFEIPGSAYTLEAVYWQPNNDLYTMILRISGGYAFYNSQMDEAQPIENLQGAWLLPNQMLIREIRGEIIAQSVRPTTGPTFEIMSDYPFNVTASEQWLASATDQLTAIYDLATGEWVETLAPPGYHQFRLWGNRTGGPSWSSDSQYLAMFATQQNNRVLLIARLEELPPVPQPAQG